MFPISKRGTGGTYQEDDSILQDQADESGIPAQIDLYAKRGE